MSETITAPESLPADATTTPPAPAIPSHLVAPSNIAHLARLAHHDPGSSRFPAMGCVRMTLAPDGRYSVRATDGRLAGTLTGDSTGLRQHARLPDDGIPSEAEALIPARPLTHITSDVRGAGKLRVKLAPPGKTCPIDVVDPKGQPVAYSLVAVEGRFPDVDYATPKGPPVAKVVIDPELMARLMAVCAGLAQGDVNFTTIEFRGERQPLVVRCGGVGGQSFVGLIMPAHD